MNGGEASSTRTSTDVRYRPELDGLRAVAITLVVLYHFRVPGFRGTGATGVDIFFVLSGYLITTLLLGEQRHHGQISYGLFLTRRFLRLFPALALVVLACGFISARGSHYGLTALSILTYTANYFYVTGHSLGVLGQTWSLAVEEQFYVLWPLVLVVLMRRRARELPWMLAGGALAIMVLRALAVHFTHGDSFYVKAAPYYVLHEDGLLLGCALACFGRFKRTPNLAIVALALLVVLGMLCPGAPVGHVVSFEIAVDAILAAILIATLHRSETLTRVLASRGFVYGGKLSYSIYLWHLPVLYVLSRHPDATPSLGRFVLELIATVACAAISYHLVELRFLALRTRLRPKQSATGSLPSNPSSAHSTAATT